MASCKYCGSFILFGGVNHNGERYCNDDCRENGFAVEVANRLPEEVVAERLHELHHQSCPVCKGSGPIDLHTSHSIWSIVILTSYRSNPRLSCRSCAVRAKIFGMLSSGLFGWWGIPWGIIMTPIQISRNFFGLFSMPPRDQPSKELENVARMSLAAEMIEEDRAAKQAAMAETVDAN